MAKAAQIHIKVTTSRNAMIVSYRTNGQIARLTANDVHNTIGDTSMLPTSGSKAFYEALLAKVITDITAGNGGGS